MFIAERAAWLNAQGQPVEDNDPTAVSLLFGAGTQVDRETIEKHGVQDYVSDDPSLLPINADPFYLGTSQSGLVGNGDTVRMGLDTTDPGVVGGPNYVGTSQEVLRFRDEPKRLQAQQQTHNVKGQLQQFGQSNQVVEVEEKQGPELAAELVQVDQKTMPDVSLEGMDLNEEGSEEGPNMQGAGTDAPGGPRTAPAEETVTPNQAETVAASREAAETEPQKEQGSQSGQAKRAAGANKSRQGQAENK